MSGWNDEALQGAFQNALNDSIKDELVPRDDSESLDQLISLTIKIDNHLRERSREKATKPPAAFSSPTPRPLPSSLVLHPQASTSSPEPMHFGKAQLTPEEPARRINSKSCLYCGQLGHFISSCPTRPVKELAHH